MESDQRAQLLPTDADALDFSTLRETVSQQQIRAAAVTSNRAPCLPADRLNAKRSIDRIDSCLISASRLSVPCFPSDGSKRRFVVGNKVQRLLTLLSQVDLSRLDLVRKVISLSDRTSIGRHIFHTSDAGLEIAVIDPGKPFVANNGADNHILI